jgi:hypothetical protein
MIPVLDPTKPLPRLFPKVKVFTGAAIHLEAAIESWAREANPLIISAVPGDQYMIVVLYIPAQELTDDQADATTDFPAQAVPGSGG